MYEIDFTRHIVIRKVIEGRHSINMKSIFFGIKTRSKVKKLAESDKLKEFINEQEHQGNKVLIPKLNETILAV